MVALDELNDLRQKQDWDALADRSRKLILEEPSSIYVLRALIQALEKQDNKAAEYEQALLRLYDLNDRPIETAHKLADYYKEHGEKDYAIRYYQTAIELAAEERQYDALEEYWMELIDLQPNQLSFFFDISKKLSENKQRQRAALFLQMILPVMEEREDWANRLNIINEILNYTPDDESLRETAIDNLQKMYQSPDLQKVIDHTSLQDGRPLSEALAEAELLVKFLPDSFVRHPDWGIGKVKELDMKKRKVKINFQKKRNHMMDIELAKNAVENLAEDDFRVLAVVNKDHLKTLSQEDPVELIKILLRSFNGTINTKEIKENLVGKVIENRHWSSWWSKTNTELRKDPYIQVTGGSNKQFSLREVAINDEDELLIKFDETRSPISKVDLVYSYLRTTKKTEQKPEVLMHFSKKMTSQAPKRKKDSEQVELFLTNEDLKRYCDEIESMRQDLLDNALKDVDKSIRTIQLLRFKSHQQLFAARLRTLHPEEWPDAYERMLLEPDIEIRDSLAKFLVEIEQQDRINTIVDTTLNDFRNYPRTFIWLAENELTGSANWLKGKLTRPQIIERLLLLVDNLTSQSKRREREESLWLRKVAGDAREIIRRNNYSLFKESIQEADESQAQSIYRRSQTNEGLDARTSSDLTTIVRAKFPNLFQQVSEEETTGPEAWLCLKESLDEKKVLMKRLIEVELPVVVQEIETARQHGDLKENAEYHAAREKQKLMASQVSDLQDAISQANWVNPAEVETDQIGFGTLFKVTPVGSDTTEEYILLGPWESDPDKNVLSYQAPFSRAFMGKKVGDDVAIELPMHTGRYEVLEITKIPDDRLKIIIEREKKYDQERIEALSSISDEDEPNEENTNENQPATVNQTGNE